MKKNFHAHTYYCNHSELSIEDNIKLYKKNGYKTIGISEHIAIPGFEDRFRLQLEETDKYIKEVREAAKRESHIEVLCGLEAEYLLGDKEHLEYLKELRKKVDYLILANHIIGDLKKGDFIHFSRNDPTPKDLELNVKLLKEGWNTGLFAFIAHPDSILKRYSWDKYAEEMAHEIGRFAEKSGALLEINANGIRYGRNRNKEDGTHAYTNLNFWKIVAQYNVRVIISNDSHYRDDLKDEYLEECVKLAKDLKLEVVDDFRDI